MPYHRKREYLHSYTPNTAPLTMKDSTDSHSPVLWILPIRQTYGLDAAARASSRAVSAASACRR